MAKFDYQKQVQDYYAQRPVIVLGSGASVACGLPGVDKLADYIQSGCDTKQFPEDQLDNWREFCALLEAKTDLEKALSEVAFSEEMTDMIVYSAWELISKHDGEVYKKSLMGRYTFPLGKILSHMFRSSMNEINIVTTNYDCLAEYACDQGGWYHYSGFSHGYTNKLSQPQNLITCRRTVNIWKVHGSIDWFCLENDETISIARPQYIPDRYKPQIVTPGIQKYERTHFEPFRTIIGRSDRAVDNANSYLCFGFGFRDNHIQPKLISRCKNNNASIIVATHTLTEQAKKFLFSGEIKKFLAIERGERDGQSRIFSSLHDNHIPVDKDYWSMDGFVNLIM